MFERGLEASVDHLLHSSAVRHLNDDLSETSVENVSYGCSASFEDGREDISGCRENEVSSVSSNSFGGVEKFGSHMVKRQSLQEDEDVGWFFEEEAKDPHLLDNYDSEKTIFTEHTNSNFAVDSADLPSEDCKHLSAADYLAEELDNTRLCCLDPNSASLFQCLEIEDEFEDCFSDAVFGLRESETKLNGSNSHQESQTLNRAERRGNDISSHNSTNLVLLNERLNSEMFHEKVDSNSKLTEEFAMFSSQCDKTGNSTLFSSDCLILSKDKAENLLDCENTLKYQTVVDKTEDFGCENTAQFLVGHSDLVEKDIHATTSNTIFEEAKNMCSKCVRPYCHCANDAHLLVEPDCLILAQDTASKAPNCPLASAERQPCHTSLFNFSNKYSRHSLLISSSEESKPHHTAQGKQTSDDELQHELISSQNALGLCVNSAAGDHPKAFGCKSLLGRDNDICRSDDSVILTTLGTNGCEKRVDNDCFEHSDTFRNEKEDLSISKVAFCDAAVESGNAQTGDSCGLLNMQSCFDCKTAYHDVIQDSKENAFSQDKMCNTVFEQRLAMLGSKLSHGADDMMKLVIKMAYQQLKDNGSTRCKQLLDIYSTRIYLLSDLLT